MKHYVLPSWWTFGQKILTGDLDRIECGVNATNILTPGQSDPSDMKVHVSGGYVYFDEHAYYFTATDSPTFVAPTVNPRWDTLYLDNDGSLKIVQGSEHSSPTKPLFASGQIPVAYVYHRVGETKLIDYFEDDSINGYIVDARKFITAADMQKSVYDTNLDGIVNDSEKLGGVSALDHVLRDGSRKLTGHQDFDGHKAINLLDPVQDQDAVTIHYLNYTGYMLKSVYDTNDNDIVDDSERLGGVLAVEYFKRDGSVLLTGNVNADGNDIINLGILKFIDLAFKAETSTLLALMNASCAAYQNLKLATLQVTAGIGMNDNRITGLPLPLVDDETANKLYVDTRPFEFRESNKIAGEPLVYGDIVRLESDNKWRKTNISIYSKTSGILAMVLSLSVGSDELVTVLVTGIQSDVLWSYTPGDVIYLGAVAGSFTETRPTASGQMVRKIGYAYDANSVYFNPDSTVLEVL